MEWEMSGPCWKANHRASSVRRWLGKNKYLSERILERRGHFSFSCNSFRKLFIFQMKTFSLNSKQLLLFTKNKRKKKKKRKSLSSALFHPSSKKCQPNLTSWVEKSFFRTKAKKKCCQYFPSSYSCCYGGECNKIPCLPTCSLCTRLFALSSLVP